MIRHHTARHLARSIQASGLVEPRRQPLLGVDLSWWHDLPTPFDPDDVGLGAYSLGYSRVAAAFAPLDLDGLIRWRDYKARHRTSPSFARAASRLELGRLTRCWWVAEIPIEVERVAP